MGVTPAGWAQGFTGRRAPQGSSERGMGPGGRPEKDQRARSRGPGLHRPRPFLAQPRRAGARERPGGVGAAGNDTRLPCLGSCWFICPRFTGCWSLVAAVAPHPRAACGRAGDRAGPLPDCMAPLLTRAPCPPTLAWVPHPGTPSGAAFLAAPAPASSPQATPEACSGEAGQVPSRAGRPCGPPTDDVAGSLWLAGPGRGAGGAGAGPCPHRGPAPSPRSAGRCTRSC